MWIARDVTGPGPDVDGARRGASNSRSDRPRPPPRAAAVHRHAEVWRWCRWCASGAPAVAGGGCGAPPQDAGTFRAGLPARPIRKLLVRGRFPTRLSTLNTPSSRVFLIEKPPAEACRSALPASDMAASGQPLQTLGFQTSVDIARRQPEAYTTAQAALKRRHDGDHEGLAKAPGGRTSIMNNIYQNDHRDSVTFVRASASTRRNRIAASEIRPGPGTVTADQAPPAPSQTATQNALLSLQHPRYGLPSALVANLAALGISSIYPWQASCLLARGLLSGQRNLVYSAPTGGGKSLVADVLMLKRIIENPSRKAILVLPYVALVQEKLQWLRRVVQDVEKNVPDDDDEEEEEDADLAQPRRRRKQPHRSIRVTGFFGGSKTRSSWADTDIAVCTIEKVSPNAWPP